MKTIVAAVDFSSVTPGLIAEAALLARPTGSRVILVHVTEPTAAIIDFAIVSVSVARIDEARVAEARKRLESLRSDLAATGLESEVRELIGMPVAEIVTVAKDVGADLIVMGSHGHSALHDLLVGSTTAGVVKRAPCPVAVVPAARKRAPAGDQLTT